MDFEGEEEDPLPEEREPPRGTSNSEGSGALGPEEVTFGGMRVRP